MEDLRTRREIFVNIQLTTTIEIWVWFFLDSCFLLLNRPGEVLLKFLCEIFHPAVREECQEWEEFINRINELLKPDG